MTPLVPEGAPKPKPDPYIRAGFLVRWHDADTAIVNLDLGFNTWVRNVHIRLRNTWADEKGTPGGDAALAWAESRWPKDTPVIVRTFKPAVSSFGRYPGDIWTNDASSLEDLGTQIIAAGYARRDRDKGKKFG